LDGFHLFYVSFLELNVLEPGELGGGEKLEIVEFYFFWPPFVRFLDIVGGVFSSGVVDVV
jgi:hypothetical protein